MRIVERDDLPRSTILTLISRVPFFRVGQILKKRVFFYQEGFSSVNVSYRSASPSDLEFLYQLHRAAMRPSVEQTWGNWQEEWQRNRFEQRFAPEVLQIILCDGQPVGVLHVDERTEERFVAMIAILPAFQGRGLGTQALRQVMQTAADQGKPVVLRVLKINQRALNFYQRLGFSVTAETITHFILIWEPTPFRRSTP